MDSAWLGATELLAAFHQRTLSPVDVLGGLRARCDRLNPRLNAFYEFDWPGAEQAAQASAVRWSRGVPQGALDGVPVSVKDHLAVRGLSSPRGLALGARRPETEDCIAVAHLRAAGAVLFGKTVMPELSIMSVTDGAAFGPTRNPWDLSRTSGGSSGGATAAVAAGLGPLALATDGGGSIRHPCGFTGLVGVKPSHGRVPYYPGPTDRTVAGPIARSVADAALMLSVLARPTGHDWTEIPVPAPDYVCELADRLPPLRIAFSRTFGYLSPEPEVADMVARAVDRLAARGHRIEPIDAVCDDLQSAHLIQAAPRLAAWMRELPPEYLAHLASSTRAVLDFMGSVTLADYDAMLKMRDAAASRLTALFRRFDVLLSPVTPGFAPKVGAFYPEGDLLGDAFRSIGGYTRPFNLLHLPAVTVPCGFAKVGLPIGLQIAGPKLSESTLLRLATAVESDRMRGCGVRRPPVDS